MAPWGTGDARPPPANAVWGQEAPRWLSTGLELGRMGFGLRGRAPYHYLGTIDSLTRRVDRLGGLRHLFGLREEVLRQLPQPLLRLDVLALA